MCSCRTDPAPPRGGRRSRLRLRSRWPRGRRTVRRPDCTAPTGAPACTASAGCSESSARIAPSAGSAPNANASLPEYRSAAVAAPNSIAPTQPRSPKWRRAIHREHGRGSRGRERCRELGCQRRRHGREQHAVAEHRVARVPVVVPDRESLLPEHLCAEQVRGEVDARRRDDHVDRCEDRRDQRRSSPPQNPRASNRGLGEGGRAGDGAVVCSRTATVSRRRQRRTSRRRRREGGDPGADRDDHPAGPTAGDGVASSPSSASGPCGAACGRRPSS